MLDRILAAVLVVPFALGAASSPASEKGAVELTFSDPEIVESSGLAVLDDLLVTTNDSGDTGRLFVVGRSGRTVGVTRWSDSPVDVEALAPGAGNTVWVGDIGDNPSARESIEVSEVEVGRGEREVTATSYSLVYPDGAHDAESLLRHPRTGRLYVATKTVFGAKLYEAPRELRADAPNRLRALGGVVPIATDGAFLPDGEHLVLRDYSQATVYSFPDLERLATFRLPSQQQGEGLAVTPDSTLLVSTEGQFSDVLRVPLPDDVRLLLGLEVSEAPSASPEPSGEGPTGSYSREGVELPEQEPVDRPVWPWFLTGWIVVGGIVLLMRSLRSR